MKKIVFFLLIIFYYNLFSQVAVAVKHNSAFLPHGLSLPLLNGYGNSALHNDVSNIGSLNPAALENFNNIMFGFSYQYETKIDESWIADIGSKRINNWVPQSIGFIVPYYDVRFAISMYQKYNRSLLFGPIEISTIENPDGIGEFIEVEYETFIYNYSFTTSYTYKNFLSNSELSFGFRIGLNNLTEYYQIYKSFIDASVYATDISFGVLYSTPRINNHYLKFGIFYQSKLEFNEQVEIFNIEVPNEDNSLFPNRIYPTEMRLVAKFPSTIRFDIDITKIEKFQFSASISNSYWNSIYDHLKNQIEITSSISYLLSNSFTPSLGFVYSEKEFVEDFFEANEKLDVVFITLGSSFRFNSLSIHFALADSHLFSGDFRETTIGKLSLSYSL